MRENNVYNKKIDAALNSMTNKKLIFLILFYPI